LHMGAGVSRPPAELIDGLPALGGSWIQRDIFVRLLIHGVAQRDRWRDAHALLAARSCPRRRDRFAAQIMSESLLGNVEKP